MTVYVRWYGNVLQGELLDGEYLGMKQVKIPVDGRNPVALFTPGHVYMSELEVVGVAEEEKSCGGPRKSDPVNDILPADDRQMIESFKRENWDAERGHLRIDKLDEFYQLWRMVVTPFGYVEAEAVHESRKPVPAITKGYSEITQPYLEITQPYSGKKIQIVELSLFD